ncbi:small multidrug resistance pump [Ruaniaceae bacterium KH17]|nr:small multidrug resistance pump [Ruaniaceae bacterium KH17]
MCEVTATLSLRATVDSSSWIPLVVLGYAAAYVFLGFALRAGMPIGVAYGVWGAIGVALVALLGMAVFDEVLSPLTFLGIAIIIAGVVLVETGSHTPSDTAGESA